MGLAEPSYWCGGEYKYEVSKAPGRRLILPFVEYTVPFSSLHESQGLRGCVAALEGSAVSRNL